MTGPAAGPSSDVGWFERTAHCGGCGQPGSYCLCTPRRPCGCRALHAMGSGLHPEALNHFGITDEPDPNQGDLW